MSTKAKYLLLSILGLILPYSFFLPWLLQHGFAPHLFLQQCAANAIGRFFVFDVLISAIVLFAFIRTERRHRNIPHLWLPIFGTLLVGVSFGLPIFLYLRELSSDLTPIPSRT